MNISEHRLVGLLVILIFVVVNAGCATVTKGTSQTVTVTTDPAGARCTLTREGAILAVMDPTPGSLVIKKSKKDVSVNCLLAEYKDTTGVFESKFADATMGNILLGGVIGAAIDASSGASHEYDPIVTLTMIPLQFSSIADRDAFFDKMRADFIQGSEESIKLIAKKCKKERCDIEKKAATEAREARLAEIERERQIAKIGNSEERVPVTVVSSIEPNQETPAVDDPEISQKQTELDAQSGVTTTTASIEKEVPAQEKPGDLCDVFATETLSPSTDWVYGIPGRYSVDTKFQGLHAADSVDFRTTGSGAINGQLGHAVVGNKITGCSILGNDMLSCTFVGQSYHVSPGNNAARIRFSNDFTQFCGYVFPAGSAESEESTLKLKITGVRI